ncbi:hypothetical protein CF327_g3540 [Tilletia walkeri]|uniref:Uncharacterized protein n=1 Tax=Tilletia walkeri TaxID=117179 RepID=A0A8X7T190_9BASI|nr:hypothetical protein CF327_g3540 [Tilletia walkeri]KAE8261318.1 hypothetical protein A4X09_0g7677 [Tilletia walkeri]
MATTGGLIKLGTTLTLSTGVAAALAYTAYTHQPSKTLLTTWNQCTSSHAKSNSSWAIIDSALCILLPLFHQARADLVSTGLFSLSLSGIFPLIAHSTYIALSPNARISFLSAALPALAAAMFFIGGGIIAAGPYVILYALGSLLFLFKRASFSPLPTRALGVTIHNITLFLYFAAGFALMLFDPRGDKWYKAFIAILLIPLGVLNLPSLAGGFKIPNNEIDVREGIASYTAGDLSSAFESTWSSYRRVGLASAIFYWYGIGRIGNAFYYEPPSTLTDVSLNSLLTFIGTSTALLSLIAIERLTFRASASSIKTVPNTNVPRNTKTMVTTVTEQTARAHPFTGQMPSKVDLECEKAVARAPAGHPVAEVGWKGTAFAFLLGGPGMAACFWWARGEEEAGWKARREWREIQALTSKKE